MAINFFKVRTFFVTENSFSQDELGYQLLVISSQFSVFSFNFQLSTSNFQPVAEPVEAQQPFAELIEGYSPLVANH